MSHRPPLSRHRANLCNAMGMTLFTVSLTLVQSAGRRVDVLAFTRIIGAALLSIICMLYHRCIMKSSQTKLSRAQLRQLKTGALSCLLCTYVACLWSCNMGDFTATTCYFICEQPSVKQHMLARLAKPQPRYCNASYRPDSHRHSAFCTCLSQLRSCCLSC